MLRFFLLPFALISAALFAMSAQIMASTLHHRLAWQPTIGTVIETKMILVPTGKHGKPQQLAVSIEYSAGGTMLTWTGLGKDAGIYNAEPADRIQVYYNPMEPTVIDTAAAKGWRGGLLILIVSGGLAALYFWFFWMRKGPPALMPPRYSTTFGTRAT